MSPRTERSGTLVLPVHGVGHQSGGEIEATVREALRSAGHDVDAKEFNWDPGSPTSFELGEVLIQAAHVDSRPTEGRGRRLVALQDLLLVAAESLNGLLLLLVAVVAPVVLYGDQVVEALRAPTGSAAPSLLSDHLVSFGSWLLVGLAAVLLVSLSIGGARPAARRGRRREMTSAFRRVSLVLLRPILTLLLQAARLVCLLPRSSQARVFAGISLVVYGLAAVAVLLAGSIQGAGGRLVLASLAFILVVFRTPPGTWLRNEACHGRGGRRLAAGLMLLGGAVLIGITLVRGIAALDIQGRVITVVAFVLFVLLVVLSLVLKIVADCLRYVSDDGYRRRVQGRLDHRVRQARDECSVRPRRIVLAAHSLGTVVAVDALLTSRVWKGFSEVILVTMGSPLRRWFLRFFPGIRVPLAIEDMSASMRASVPGFRWLNVFRPLDYVGARLAHEGSGIIEETATRQECRFHVGYWGDPGVIGAVASSLSGSTASDRRPETSRGPFQPSSSTLRFVRPLLRWQTMILGPLLLLVALTGVIRECGVASGDLRAWHMTRGEGSRAGGRVVPARIFITKEEKRRYRLMGHQHYTWEYDFRYAVDGRAEDVTLRGARAAESFDSRSLQRSLAVRKNLYREDAAAGTTTYLYIVNLRYEVLNPRRFTLVDFPPVAAGSDSPGWFDRTWQPFLLCVLWVIAGSAALKTLFLGSRPGSQ